jgi:hypothetical protein
MAILRKLRLVAAIGLICASVLPLSECSRRENHLLPIDRSISHQLFPQTNADFGYPYAYQMVDFSASGIVTVMAFIWPFLLILAARRWSGPRMRWVLQVLELLLCAGTIYWVNTLTLGGRWLYGAYVGVSAAILFTGSDTALRVRKQNMRSA